MNKETVTFEFPRELVEQADVAKLVYWGAMAKDPHCTSLDRLRSVLNAQILEWQKTQQLRVTPDTPAGADVIYTNRNGEEHPAVLVAHRRNAEAWIWISSDPSNYLLNLIKLEDLRLAGKDEG